MGSWDGQLPATSGVLSRFTFPAHTSTGTVRALSKGIYGDTSWPVDYQEQSWPGASGADLYRYDTDTVLTDPDPKFYPVRSGMSWATCFFRCEGWNYGTSFVFAKPYHKFYFADDAPQPTVALSTTDCVCERAYFWIQGTPANIMNMVTWMLAQDGAVTSLTRDGTKMGFTVSAPLCLFENGYWRGALVTDKDRTYVLEGGRADGVLVPVTPASGSYVSVRVNLTYVRARTDSRPALSDLVNAWLNVARFGSYAGL